MSYDRGPRGVIARELGGRESLPAGDDEIRLLRNLFLALRRNALRIFLFALAAAILAGLLTFTVEPKYRSTAQVMLDTRVVADPTYTPVVSGLPTTLTSLESELEVLRSTDLIERVVIEMKLHELPVIVDPEASVLPSLSDLRRTVRGFLPQSGGADGNGVELSPEEAAIEVIAQAREIEQIGTTSAVYQVSVTLPDRRLAAQVANALAEEYLETQRVEKLRSLERSQGWLAERTAQLQEALSAYSAELEAHSIEAPLSEEEYETVRVQRTNVTRQLNTLSLQSDEAAAALETARAGLAAGDSGAAAAALGLPTDAAPEAIEAGLTRVEAQTDALNAERARLEAQLARLRAQQEQQALHDAETRRIENEIAVTEAIYRDFVSQLSRRTEQDEYLDADGRIIEVARPAQEPAEPRRTSAAAGAFLVAALLAALLVAVREMAQTRMRTLREISEELALPAAGAVVELPKLPGGLPLPAAVAGGLMPMPQGAAMRYAKRLRAALDAQLGAIRPGALREGRATVIAGASALPDEGQSTALFLLGAASAAAGERVLLIDCDFRRSPYRDLGSDAPRDPRRGAERGLLDRLAPVAAAPGLSILTSDEDSWSEDPAPLTAAEFEGILADLSGHFDRILVDTPPLAAVADSLDLLPQADGVVFFTRWNHTPSRAARGALRALREAGIQPLFAVATRVDLKRVGGYGDSALPNAKEEAQIVY